MKKHLLLIAVVLISLASAAQNFYTHDFENPYPMQYLTIDTASNPNNVWQVGSPQKTVFTTAVSLPNVIVTDTANAYPVNDTSSFTIKHVADMGFMYQHTVALYGQYYVNSDSLTDFGMIEFSPDNGTTWYDIVNDTFITNNIYVPQGWVQLTGNSNGWQSFYVNLAPMGQWFNVQPNDTVLWRFSFISDNIQTNKDGLMFDDLHFEDYVEGIPVINTERIISLFPNPTDNELKVSLAEVGNCPTLEILNCKGEVIIAETDFKGGYINTQDLSEGVYILKYSDTKSSLTKRFIVLH